MLYNRTIMRMDRDRVYYSTRRPSRLRDSYSRQSPDRLVDSGRSNYGYRRPSMESYDSMESSYRDVGKRPYGTSYQRYASEDSYARPYDRIYSYSRREPYPNGYKEYNTRSRGYVAMDQGYVDSRYPEPSTSRLSLRSSGRPRINYRSIVEPEKVNRRTVSRWVDPVEPPKDPMPSSNGKMQLRYNQKRRLPPTTETRSTHVNAKAVIEPAQVERNPRGRQPSPRKPKVEQPPAQQPIPVAAPPRITNKTKVETVPAVSEVPVKKEEKQAITKVSGPPVVTPVTTVDEQTSVTPVAKKKRGRPKGVKTSVKRAAPPPRPKVKKELTDDESDTASSVAITTPRKKACIRTKTSSAVTTDSGLSEAGDEITEEESKNVHKLSAQRAIQSPKAGRAHGSSAVNSPTTVSKLKDANASSGDDDMKDLDYNPTTSMLASASKTRKARGGTPKVTTPKRVAKVTTKVRVLKRAKTTPNKEEIKTEETPREPEPIPVPIITPVQLAEAMVPVVNDGPGSAKMLFFEEYLDMSERMYCGKPLCLRDPEVPASTKAVAAINKENQDDEDKPLVKQERLVSSDLKDGSVENKAKNTEQSNSEKGPDENGQDSESKEDPLFEFQCSNLALRYRVAFAMLTSDLRQTQMLDLWGPKELVLFELGMFKHGKEFHEIQRLIPTKTVQDIVDMYYLWKKTNRYKLWKANRQY